MGNLRQSMTDTEWYQEERQFEEDRRNGKPDSYLIYFSAPKTLEEAIKLKETLLNFYDDFELRGLNAWIEWYSKAK